MKKRTKKRGPSWAIPVLDLYPISQKVSGGLGKQPGAMGGGMPAGGQQGYF